MKVPAVVGSKIPHFKKDVERIRQIGGGPQKFLVTKKKHTPVLEYAFFMPFTLKSYGKVCPPAR